MHFNRCCEKRNSPCDIALDDGEYYCRLCGSYLGKTFVFDYKDFSHYRMSRRKPYDPKNHANLVLNCLECVEQNRPTYSFIDKLKEQGIHTKEDIGNALWKKSRKHSTYVWWEINGIEHLRIKPEHRSFLVNKICETLLVKKQLRSYPVSSSDDLHSEISKSTEEKEEMTFFALSSLNPAYLGPILPSRSYFLHIT